MDISYQIERLLSFALNKEIIEKQDIIYTRNILMDLLRIKEPFNEKVCIEAEKENETASDILSVILDYCAEKGIIQNNTATQRDLMDAKIMGVLLSRPSDICCKFDTLEKESIKTATNWFYKLNRDINYIQVDRINKNLYWLAETEYGSLEITINISKPEKDPREIAAASSSVQPNYPKCQLCADNEGFAGHINHPARQNLRLIPFTLDNEQWYFQYSPYVYYNEHCIVLNENHTPMMVNERTFRRLFDFTDRMPHYFIGSNAGIPIVGGSILSHDHYQGGRYVFPMEKARPYAYYTRSGFSNVSVSIINWPMPVIRLLSDNREDIINLAAEILGIWQNYSDEQADILSHTNNSLHNAVTPIARVNTEGKYELDIVLRNNRTSDDHPMGIFHPHSDLHHIKKENIGLIEVMGLAVLPGRLDEEMKLIAAILTGKADNNFCGNSLLVKHEEWIYRLINKYGTKNDDIETDKILKNEIGQIFLRVLQDAGVYKSTDMGKKQLHKFMEACKMSFV